MSPKRPKTRKEIEAEQEAERQKAIAKRDSVLKRDIQRIKNILDKRPR
jgi:hypothetical protein